MHKSKSAIAYAPTSRNNGLLFNNSWMPSSVDNAHAPGMIKNAIIPLPKIAPTPVFVASIALRSPGLAFACLSVLTAFTIISGAAEESSVLYKVVDKIVQNLSN